MRSRPSTWYEIPQPAWHGHAQTIYRLRAANPYLLLDQETIESIDLAHVAALLEQSA